MDVVIVGSCVMDMICYTTNLPKEGETIIGSKFTTGFGGKGANQCVSAGKLGAKVAMVSKVGNDSNGREYLNNLKDCNVDCDKVSVIEGTATGVAAISVAGNGSNCIIIVPGANNEMTVGDVEAARDLITSCRVLVCQNEIPQEVSVAAMKLAVENKVKVIYNPAPAEKNMNADLFKLPDFFCPNETEAELLTSCPVTCVEDSFKASQMLIEEHGCKAVVMTLGEKGVVYLPGKGQQPVHIPTQVVKAVDTTGAGDSFIGSFAYFLAKSDIPVSEMLERANVVASVSVTKPGTQSSFPRADQLPENLFGQIISS